MLAIVGISTSMVFLLIYSNLYNPREHIIPIVALYCSLAVECNCAPIVGPTE